MGTKLSIGNDTAFMTQITRYNWSTFAQIQNQQNIHKLIKGIDLQKSKCCPGSQFKYCNPGNVKSGAIYKINKSFYVGEIRNQQPNGMGVVLNEDLTAYKGQFSQGRPHGNGSMYNKNMQLVQQGKWIRGSFLKGKIILNNQNIIEITIENDDYYTVSYQNGSKYSGTGIIRDNTFYRNGKGRLNIPAQYEYFGDWVMNKREGKAYIKSRNYQFNGHYKNDMKLNGKLEANNYVYEGDWQGQFFTGWLINKSTKAKKYIQNNEMQNNR